MNSIPLRYRRIIIKYEIGDEKYIIVWLRRIIKMRREISEILNITIRFILNW